MKTAFLGLLACFTMLLSCDNSHRNSASELAKDIDSTAHKLQEAEAAKPDDEIENAPFLLSASDLSLDNRDSIYRELLKEADVKDEGWATFLKNYADSFLADSGCWNCFPAKPFNKVFVFRMNEGYHKHMDIEQMDDVASSDSVQLSDKEAKRLYRFMNNPTNFEWGECGTAIPKYLIKFYHDDVLVASTSVACSEASTQSSGPPGRDINQSRSKYGSVKYHRTTQFRNIFLNNHMQYKSSFGE